MCKYRKNELKSGLVRNMILFPENSPCPETQNKMGSRSKGVDVILSPSNVNIQAGIYLDPHSRQS